MGSMGQFSASLLFGLLLSSLCGVPAARAQDLRERDAFCNDHGCYVVYFQRKTFLDSWKACKADGGNLAVIKRPEDADAIAALFSKADLRQLGPSVRVWIGLQRQPRQCKPLQPLRGYTWTTGDRDTQYTNWQAEDSFDACSARRCVVMEYDSSLPEHSRNFEWLEGTCFVPTDGYVCRYTYKGMCPALWSEGGGNALYATPFNLLTTMLTHLPNGTVATVPCPGGTQEDQTVLCKSKENGGEVGWSRNSPLCGADAPVSKHWCGQDNDPCEHFCQEAGDHYYCLCSEGFQLAADGQHCEVIDVCLGAPCHSECLPLPDGYRCACPEGYMLAPDEQGCLDVDECLQSPCEQLCVNSQGSFKCSCREGYRPSADGECDDVDECMDDPCEQECENTPGSYDCHCNMGFSVTPEDPRHCQETDECQIPGTCQQMCVNYVGGFDCYCEEGYELGVDHFSCQKVEEGDGQPTATHDFPWATRQPGPMWNTDFWPDQLDWLTDPPSLQSSDPSQQEGPGDGLGDLEGADVFPWEAGPEGTSSSLTHTPPTTDNPIHTPPTTTTTTTATTTSPTTAHTTPTALLVTSPAPSPEYNEDDEEEEATSPIPTLPSTSTFSEGAWNWLWLSPTPAGHRPVTAEDEEEEVMDYSNSSDSNYHDKEERDDDYFRVLYSSEEPRKAKEEKDNGGRRDSFADVPPTTAAAERGEEDTSDSVQSDKSEVSTHSTSTWLLVGLLVPTCILVVVMVALGVVYCTGCAVQQRSKSSTDCYHWISGAHDKEGVQSSSTAGKSHV